MIFSVFTVYELCILINFVLSEDSYKIYNLESDKVCSLKHFSNRISSGFDGLIVRETTYFDRLTGKHSFTCRFEVRTGSKSQFPGMFVVFQNLHMRKDHKTGDCIDYVMLRPVDKDFISENLNLNYNFKKNHFPWATFCGDLRARRDGGQENPRESGISEAGFLIDNSVVEVEIFVNKLPIVNETIELEMVFTPYLNCKNMWSEYRDCGADKCIKKQNFNDGWVNCPFLNCPDEGGCVNSTKGDENFPPELHTKVTLTAVTSIFCSFFLFLGCIWCCRYFELLCWGANTLLGRPNPVELSPMTRRAPSPSAPPPDPTATKDLPPAYETLFPDR